MITVQQLCERLQRLPPETIITFGQQEFVDESHDPVAGRVNIQLEPLFFRDHRTGKWLKDDSPEALGPRPISETRSETKDRKR